MKIRDRLQEDWQKMSTYERYKLVVDFMRFMATMMAPFMIVTLGHIVKSWLGW